MKFPLFFLFMGCVLELSAQSRSPIVRDVSDSWHNAKAIYTSPLRYSLAQWLTVAGVLGLTVSAHFLDASVRTVARTHQTPALTRLFFIGELYGHPLCAGTLGGGLYLGGLFSRNTSTRLTGRAVLESALYASLLTQVLKMTIGRSRPYLNTGARNFNGLAWTNDHWSFPSGHTTIAFATSAALSVRLKRPLATAALFTLALLTTGQRLYDDQHWLSDTLFGAAIGTSIGLAVAHLIHQTQPPQHTSPSHTISPILSLQFPL